MSFKTAIPEIVPGEDPAKVTVEAIDHESEGEIYRTVFYGHSAKERAEEYVKLKYAQQPDKNKPPIKYVCGLSDPTKSFLDSRPIRLSNPPTDYLGHVDAPPIGGPPPRAADRDPAPSTTLDTIGALLDHRDSILDANKLFKRLGISGSGVDNVVSGALATIGHALAKHLSPKQGYCQVVKWRGKYVTYAQDGNYTWNGLRFMDVPDASNVKLDEPIDIKHL